MTTATGIQRVVCADAGAIVGTLDQVDVLSFLAHQSQHRCGRDRSRPRPTEAAASRERRHRRAGEGPAAQRRRLSADRAAGERAQSPPVRQALCLWWRRRRWSPIPA
jgi:hypothetical protein